MSRSEWVPSGLAYRPSVSGVMRAEAWPVTSVPLVEYLARYAATARSVTAPVPVRVMMRISSWVPQVTSQPSGWAGCGSVRKLMPVTAWRTASSRSAMVRQDGGGSIWSGW